MLSLRRRIRKKITCDGKILYRQMIVSLWECSPNVDTDSREDVRDSIISSRVKRLYISHDVPHVCTS